MNFLSKYSTEIKTLAVILLVLVLISGVSSYLHEQESKIRLQEELRATKQLLDFSDNELKSITRTMQERDKKTAELVKQVEALKARPIPVREIIKEIPKYIPIDAPVPLPAENPKDEPSVVLDPAQVQGLRVFYLDCQAKTLKLQSCEENAEDWKRKELTWQEREKILEQQRDAAITAYKGGTRWQRFKRGAKTFGVGFVLGAAAGAAAR